MDGWDVNDYLMDHRSNFKTRINLTSFLLGASRDQSWDHTGGRYLKDNYQPFDNAVRGWVFQHTDMNALFWGAMRH